MFGRIQSIFATAAGLDRVAAAMLSGVIFLFVRVLWRLRDPEDAHRRLILWGAFEASLRDPAKDGLVGNFRRSFLPKIDRPRLSNNRGTDRKLF